MRKIIIVLKDYKNNLKIKFILLARAINAQRIRPMALVNRFTELCTMSSRMSSSKVSYVSENLPKIFLTGGNNFSACKIKAS